MSRKAEQQKNLMGAAFRRDGAPGSSPVSRLKPTAKKAKTTVEFEQAEYRRLRVWLVENGMTLQAFVQAATAEILDGSPFFADMIRARAKANDAGDR